MALMVGFAAGVIGTGVWEVGSRKDLKRVGRVVEVLICGKGNLEPNIRLGDDARPFLSSVVASVPFNFWR